MPKGASLTALTSIPIALVRHRLSDGTDRSSSVGFNSIKSGAEAIVNGWLKMRAGISINIPFSLLYVVPNIGVPATLTSPHLRVDLHQID